MLNEIAGILAPQDFYRDKYGEYYKAALALSERREPVDQLSLAIAAKVDARELNEIVAATPTTIHAEHYAKIVREMTQRRRMIASAGRIAKLAYEEEDWERAQAQAYALMETIGQSDVGQLKHIEEQIIDVLPAIEDLLEHQGSLPGRATHLRSLDMKIRGLDKGKLYIIAGRPSMGKTWLSLYLSRRIVQSGLPVAYFSADTTKKWFVIRVVHMVIGDDAKLARVAPLEMPEHFRQSLSIISRWPLYMDDHRGQDLVAMRLDLKRLQAKEGPIGMICYDYLELAGQRTRGENEEIRLSVLTKGFKDLAREFDCPMVLLSQLNREVEKRENAIPRLSDSRYSGMVDQEADVWMGLYRKEWYLQERGLEIPSEDMHHLLVNVDKNKDGPRGYVHLYYNQETGVIKDWEG